MNSKDLRTILQKEVKTVLQNFGGEGKYLLPKSHKPFKEIPIDGASCANCNYLGKGEKDEYICSNELYIRWNGSNKIKQSINKHTSDWWELKKSE